MTEDTKQQIRGALARGYCTKENETKVLDPELIEAMAQEVDSVINQALTAKREQIVVEIESTDIERAHTYSSENADVYRAYDAGQERMKTRLLNLIQSHKPL